MSTYVGKASPLVALSHVTSSQRTIENLNPETKPLPRLPRGWSRLSHETGLFLRTIGLGIVVVTFHGLFIKSFVEPTKAAVIGNRFSSSLRSLIHVLPIAIALMEIIVNWNGLYVGAAFSRQTYLQFAAKAHEVTFQASLAVVFLAYLRHKVTRSMGITFGAFLGGSQFLQISYLWSAEFWSSILSKQFQIRGKLGFFILALTCTLLAATTGPSSANLLIPRQTSWSLQSFNLSFNGTFNDFWPDLLDGKGIPTYCATISSDSSTDDRRCLMNNFVSFLRGNTPLFPHEQDDNTLLYLESQSNKYLYQKMIFSALCTASSRDQYCATSAQEGFLQGVTNPLPIGADKILDSEPSDAIDYYEVIQDKYYRAYTIASCVRSRVNGTSSQTSIPFARISETDLELGKDRETVVVPHAIDLQASYALGTESQYRTTWVDMPEDVFNKGMLGLAIIRPQKANGSTNVTACTLGAGWGSSKLMYHGQDGSKVYSRMASKPPSWPSEKLAPMDLAGFVEQANPNFANHSGHQYPERRIIITQEWISFLNPEVRLVPGQNSTLIDMALSRLDDQPSERYVAQLMGILLANSMSRIGAETKFKVASGSLRNDQFCDGCLTYQIQRSIYGWSYQIDGVATKLAIAVMIIYCVIATAHIFYAVISGISSSAWDSAAELVALAMNSEPTHVLQNTCAGIIGTKAFKTPVRILETTEGHLELCFGEGQDTNTRISRLKVNEKYGQIAAGKRMKED